MCTTDLARNDSETKDAHETKYSAHLFDVDMALYMGLPGVHTGERVQAAANDWPPDVLFHASYASAVFHHFGVKSIVANIMSIWGKTYYPGGILTAVEAREKRVKDREEARRQRAASEAMERAARRQDRASRSNAPDAAVDTSEFSDASDDEDAYLDDPSHLGNFGGLVLPCFLFPPKMQRALVAKKREIEEAAQLEEVKLKVEQWMDAVNSGD